MSDGTADGPTLGEAYWGGYIAKAGIMGFPYSDLDDDTRHAVEAGAAAAGAAAIARLVLGQPAEPLEAERDRHRELLAEVLGDIEHVISGQAAYIDRDMLDDYRERAAALPGPEACAGPCRASDAAETILRDNVRLRGLVGQALDDAGVDEDTKAQWLERAGLETQA